MTDRSQFYLTTAIDYANGEPHLGHAFEKIGADVIARYRRARGDAVHFLIGMDEHGQKVARTAADAGVSPQELVDRVAASFQAMWARLGISYDQFIRTTQPHHARGVQALIERIFARNPDDFYEKSYAGHYCVGCESFKTDAEVVDGRCVLHPTRTLEWVEERNWFFRLSRYTDFLRDHIATHPEFVRPASRRNEILSLIEQGLEDVSASRARFTWGVPFPRPTSDGDRQTTYVWFDALPNYLTATGFPETRGEGRWPADLHVIGKDITRFHCLIWPAMLHSAGLPLPGGVWAHGFVLFGGERFSKSAGVRLELNEAIDRHGPDAFRYFLLREVPWDGDGAFSYERFDERYTAELANDLGNLASRVVSMVQKYRDGVVPAGASTPLDAQAGEALAAYRAAMDALLLHDGAAAAMRLVSLANAFVGERAPWKLAKDPALAAELDATLAALVRALAVAAVLLAPFMPGKTEELWRRLGAPGEMPRLDALPTLDVAGWATNGGEVLFPRPELAAK